MGDCVGVMVLGYSVSADCVGLCECEGMYRWDTIGDDDVGGWGESGKCGGCRGGPADTGNLLPL